MDRRVHIALWDLASYFFGCIPRNGIYGSPGSFIFNVFEELTVFPNSNGNLHSHPQCSRISSVLQSQQHILAFFFFLTPKTIGVRWELIVVLVCISLMISFLTWIHIPIILHISSLMKCLLGTLIIFVQSHILAPELSTYFINFEYLALVLSLGCDK